MARPFRVLHYFKTYRPTFTGEGVFLERCSKAMQALAPHVEHDLVITETVQPDIIPSHCSTLDRLFYLSRRPVTAGRRNLQLIWWFIRNFHRYDTIHARVHADWYFVTYIITKLTRRRLVLSATLRDSVPSVVCDYRKQFRRPALWLFRLFDAYVSISPKLQQEMQSAVAPSRCHLIPCGIEMPEPDRTGGADVRRELGIPADALVLIYVGGIIRRKDPQLLTRNLPAVLDLRADTYLLLVGPELDSTYADEIRMEVQSAGIAAHVVFAGEVMNPHPSFDAADVMVFASTSEGFGTVVPEAMAHGLPVLVRHLPEVNDFFVIDGETGFLFNTDAEYVDRLSELIKDPALRREIGTQARSFVRQRFGMRQAASRYLKVYGVKEFRDPLVSEDDSGELWRELMSLPNSSSIVNPRFHSPCRPDPATLPMLLTVIDAEEAFDWRAPCSPLLTDVSSMSAQHLAQAIFARHGVIPVYACDYPVVAQEAGYKPVLEFLEDGACEVATQLHPWVTPPIVEELTRANTYAGNLPVSLELEKVRNLTTLIEDVFGVRPILYRSGRYGAGRRTGDILKHLGYKIDASVMPRWDYSRTGGPDFSMQSAMPFWTDADRSLLEVPGTAGLVGHLADAPLWLTRSVFSPMSERLGIPGALAHMGVLERIRLSPEGISVTEAKRLVKFMLARGQKIFVLSYHSPSLVPGNLRYVRTEADRDRFLAWLDEFYHFFFGELEGRPVTSRDIWLSMQPSGVDPGPVPAQQTGPAIWSPDGTANPIARPVG